MVVDDEEVDNEKVMHDVCREMEELRVGNKKLKKEVEEINAESVPLRRERNEKADKYSRLENKMQQQQKEHANQLDRQQLIRMMHDQLDAVQGEPLHRRYEGMNYYLLYN